MVFQSRTLDLDLSVAQNFYYHAALHGIGKAEAADAHAKTCCRRWGWPTGPRTRCAISPAARCAASEIARALLHRPRLLVLDEPTVGLDIGARADILKLVRGLIASEGLSVLWATHLTDEVEPSDDASWFCTRAKCWLEGGVADLLQKTGAADMRAAFVAIVGEKEARGAA